MGAYEEFLARKALQHTPTGIADPGELSSKLFPFQQHITRWALQQGRAAVFAGCGLGKSWMALEWAANVLDETHKPVLILTPLAVAGQFVREGRDLFGADSPSVPYHIREFSDVTGDTLISVCNYERLDKLVELIPLLGGVVLDESSILKNFSGSTRGKLIQTFRETPFRLSCSATPSPNDTLELCNQAEFLGVMKRSEMMATWFINDGETTQQWRLKRHAEKEFWRWVSTWAIACTTPSDLGFPDDGYDLEPYAVHEHVIDVDQAMANQSGLLFSYEPTTLKEQRAVRRASEYERVKRVAAIVNDSREQWTVWVELNSESKALSVAIPDAVEVTGSDSAEAKEDAILGFIDGRHRVLVTKSSIAGHGCNLQNCWNTIFVGASHSHEQSYQTIRRHHRFGAKRRVNVHYVYTSADAAIIRNLRSKQQEHDAMIRKMVEAMR